MTIGISLGNITDEIGSPDFFFAFFSTITANLEPDGWGTRFPTIMHDLYAGELTQEKAEPALEELAVILAELSRLPISQVVWDVERRDMSPPWGTNVADTITDLGNYFVTSSGRDLIATLRDVLEELRNAGGTATIQPY